MTDLRSPDQTAGNAATKHVEDVLDFSRRAQDKPVILPGGTIVKSFKKGGLVKKTGLAKVHKGEIILPAKKRPKKLALTKKKNQKKKLILSKRTPKTDAEKV
jgi:copper homeostasis protein CutC